MTLLSQGYSQARPQLDDNFLGTGAILASIPEALQVLSNNNAALVVLNVAKQLKIYRYPLALSNSLALSMCRAGILITGPVQPIALSA